MEFVYRNSGKFNTAIIELLKEVVKGCEICQKNSRPKSRPFLAIPRATDFNFVVTFDLKEFGSINAL